MTDHRTTLTALDDGGTQHRRDGADPYPGVLVAEATPTPFDVAESLVETWGVTFARKVAEEVKRWGEWK